MSLQTISTTKPCLGSPNKLCCLEKRNAWSRCYADTVQLTKLLPSLWDIIGDYWTPSLKLIEKIAQGNIQALGQLLEEVRKKESLEWESECLIERFFQLPTFEPWSQRLWSLSCGTQLHSFPWALVPLNMDKNWLQRFETPDGIPGITVLHSIATESVITFTATSIWLHKSTTKAGYDSAQATERIEYSSPSMETSEAQPFTEAATTQALLEEPELSSKASSNSSHKSTQRSFLKRLPNFSTDPWSRALQLVVDSSNTLSPYRFDPPETFCKPELLEEQPAPDLNLRKGKGKKRSHAAMNGP